MNERRTRVGSRKRTLSVKRASKRALRKLAVLYPDEGVQRPRTRSECASASRPCPWVGCSMHLAVDVTRRGSLTINHPDVEIEEMRDSCALDVAAQGGATLEAVGQLMNLTRERVRQVERAAVRRLPEEMVEQLREDSEP